MAEKLDRIKVKYGLSRINLAADKISAVFCAVIQKFSTKSIDIIENNIIILVCLILIKQYLHNLKRQTVNTFNSELKRLKGKTWADLWVLLQQNRTAYSLILWN